MKGGGPQLEYGTVYWHSERSPAQLFHIAFAGHWLTFEDSSHVTTPFPEPFMNLLISEERVHLKLGTGGYDFPC